MKKLRKKHQYVCRIEKSVKSYKHQEHDFRERLEWEAGMFDLPRYHGTKYRGHRRWLAKSPQYMELVNLFPTK